MGELAVAAPDLDATSVASNWPWPTSDHLTGKLDGCLSVCLSLSGALTPVAASGLFGEKASMRKSEDKKLSFLLHPHVTSFLFARPPTATAAATGDLPLSPQLFPPILRLSCASGGEMEWISGGGGGGDGDPLRQNNRGQKRGKAKESVAAPLSFFPIIFCPSVSVRVVGNEPLSRVSSTTTSRHPIS